MAEINWYPGHMAKTRRLLLEQLRRVDLVIELCDARLPYSSRNPDLDRLAAGKRRILLLNKADLADPYISAGWLQRFQSQGMKAALVQARSMKQKEALAAIEAQTRDAVEQAALKGVRKTVRAMVVGVPNVGKSTYINRLHGGAIAKTGDRPGVTRSNQWVKISPYLELLDTPGLLWPRLDDQTAARRLCYLGTVRDEILDLDDLTLHLLDDLADTRPQCLAERYHVSDTSLRGVPLMDAVCRGRGFLLKGGTFDYDRCCKVVLDEFRAGKLGRITLESPDDPAPSMPVTVMPVQAGFDDQRTEQPDAVIASPENPETER